MTFVGSTMGVANGNVHTGDIEARVLWDPDLTDGVAGRMAVSLNDLTSVIPSLGLIRPGAHDASGAFSNGGRPPGQGAEEVRSIAFPGISIAVAADGALTFDETDLQLGLEYNTFDGRATDWNTDPNLLRGVDIIANRHSRDNPGNNVERGDPGHDFSIPLGSIQGSYAGQDADGPLGLFGTWINDGSWDANRNRRGNAHYLSTGNTGPRWELHGAFGADIAP